MRLILSGRTTTVVEEGSGYLSINGQFGFGNLIDLPAWPEGTELHYLDAALVVTPEEADLIEENRWGKIPLCTKGGVRGTFNVDVEDLVADADALREFDLGVRKFAFDDIDNLALVEYQIEKGVGELKQRFWAATGVQKDAVAPTPPEATLFLLFLAANVDTTTDRFRLEAGELSEQEEAFILGLCNSWGFFESVSTQSDLEAAIAKYQWVKSLSLNQNDFIEQCAASLPPEPALRDLTYYLCLEILFLNGRIERGSVEEDLMAKLERILKINPAVADFVFGLELFKTAVAG